MLSFSSSAFFDFKTQEALNKHFGLLINGNTPFMEPNERVRVGKFHACSRPYFCDEFRNTMAQISPISKISILRRKIRNILTRSLLERGSFI